MPTSLNVKPVSTCFPFCDSDFHWPRSRCADSESARSRRDSQRREKQTMRHVVAPPSWGPATICRIYNGKSRQLDCARRSDFKTVIRVMALSGLGVVAVLVASCARPSVNQGRKIYEENGCASCHGPDGHGDGPLASSLPARPTDLRDVSLFKRGATEDAIAKMLAEGISRVHTVPALHYTHHELLMPKFDHLTGTERRSLALYVISLRAGDSQRRVP